MSKKHSCVCDNCNKEVETHLTGQWIRVSKLNRMEMDFCSVDCLREFIISGRLEATWSVIKNIDIIQEAIT